MSATQEIFLTRETLNKVAAQLDALASEQHDIAQTGERSGFTQKHNDAHVLGGKLDELSSELQEALRILSAAVAQESTETASLTEEELITLQALEGGWGIEGRGYTQGRKACTDKGLIETYTAFRLTDSGRSALRQSGGEHG